MKAASCVYVCVCGEGGAKVALKKALSRTRFPCVKVWCVACVSICCWNAVEMDVDFFFFSWSCLCAVYLCLFVCFLLLSIWCRMAANTNYRKETRTLACCMFFVFCFCFCMSTPFQYWLSGRSLWIHSSRKAHTSHLRTLGDLQVAWVDVKREKKKKNRKRKGYRSTHMTISVLQQAELKRNLEKQGVDARTTATRP